MGTQEERKVQHHRTQKERSVHPALQTKRKNAMNGQGTQAERKVPRYRTQKERSGQMMKAHEIAKTLQAEMEHSRNAGRIHDI